VQHRRQTLTVSARVHDEHDRRTEHGSDGGRRPFRRRGSGTRHVDLSVEQAHDTFDDRDVAPGGAMTEQRSDSPCADHDGIEIATG